MKLGVKPVFPKPVEFDSGFLTPPSLALVEAVVVAVVDVVEADALGLAEAGAKGLMAAAGDLGFVSVVSAEPVVFGNPKPPKEFLADENAVVAAVLVVVFDDEDAISGVTTVAAPPPCSGPSSPKTLSESLKRVLPAHGQHSV